MIFISLEGVDGSGKTTIAKLLKDDLVQKGFKVLVTREPGGAKISEQIRTIILDNKNVSMDPWTETLLYIAARKQHLEDVIIPTLKSNTIVICDRFMDSTSVYQGFARFLGITDVDEVQNIVLGAMKPDLTLFFDITPKEAQMRILKRNKNLDRLESENFEFHEKVYEGYQILINEYNSRIRVINARKTIGEVAQEAIDIIQNVLNERKA